MVFAPVSAFLMAKRFGFNQIFRDGRHIERDKQRFGAWAMAVKRMGDPVPPQSPDSPLISTLIEKNTDNRPIMRNTHPAWRALRPIMSVVGPLTSVLRGCCLPDSG